MQVASNEVERKLHLSTEELYRAHGPFVARLLIRLGVRPEALDDAVQDVFLTVHRRGGYEAGPAKPTTYLATIAVNAAASQRHVLRAQRARSSEQPPEELVSGQSDPLRALEARQQLTQLEDALERLEPTLRNTLWLADAEGETCVAIAEKTDVPLGTVYWRLDRARKKFRDALHKASCAQRARTREVARHLAVALMLPDPRRLRERMGSMMHGKLALLAGSSMVIGLGTTPFVVARDVATPAPVVQVASAAPHEPAVSAPEAKPATRGPALTIAPLPEARSPHIVPAARPRHDAAPKSAPVSSRASTRVTAPLTPSHAPQAEARQEERRRLSETAELARAERLLAEHPRDALQIVQQLDAHEATKYLREERDYIEVIALLKSGEARLGRTRMQAFVDHYPSSAFTPAMRAQLAAR